jgi:hypothetical protein
VSGVVCAYRLVDVEPGGHSPEDGRVQILRTIGGAHYDHLEKETYRVSFRQRAKKYIWKEEEMARTQWG